MVLLAVAKENNLDIDFIETNPDYELCSRYLQLNPLKRVPTYEAPDGWVLTEVIAIALYFTYIEYRIIGTVTTQNDKTALLGQTKRDYAEVVRWMSFINSEVQPSLANWFKPLVGRRVYDQKNVEAAKKTTNSALTIFERHLATRNTYLVGEDLTLADLFAASSLSRGFQYVFDTSWQAEYPNITKWFTTVVHLPIWKAVVPEPFIVTKAVSKEVGKREQPDILQGSG